MPASQLSQLKTALSSSGLNRKSSSKKEKKAFKKGGARETDRGKTLARLESIRQSLNKFDQIETKVKHDVGGRQLKGVTGRPTSSKQAGLEQRRRELLPEHEQRGHRGTFRDRRFGESDPTMSVEDKMLERFTRERQRGQGRKGMFNLDDDDEDPFGAAEEGVALGGLTHGGRSVMDLPGDDFDMQGLGEDDEEDVGRILGRTVSREHFGGFTRAGEDDEQDEEEPRKKSKAEVMSEIISKSKMHKAERQQQKDQDEDLRLELDEDIDDLRNLLQERPEQSTNEAGPSRLRPSVSNGSDRTDVDYDQYVKSLAFEARAKPKNRTKTEEELATEEAERLQTAEARRLKRMRGESVSDDDENGPQRPKRGDLRREADDLDDDFVEDENDLLGPGLTRQDIENMKGGTSTDLNGGGLPDIGSIDESDSGEEEGDDGSDEGTTGSEEEDESASEQLDTDETLEAEESDATGIKPQSVAPAKRTKQKKPVTEEIPYTFPCPSTIDDLEDILEDLPEDAAPVVITRIRACHHPSLAQGNKEKLQDFLGVLLDYILVLAGDSRPSFQIISRLVPHVIALVKLNPITAAVHFTSKLGLMQKNLLYSVSKGSPAFPGQPELVLLRLIGVIWSTSDFSHPVAAPSMLLIGQYLAQARIRGVIDISSGLLLCTLAVQYEAESKRLVPEVINFLTASCKLLFSIRRFASDKTANLDIQDSVIDCKLSWTSSPLKDSVNLHAMIIESSSNEARTDLAYLSLRLISQCSELWVSSPAFVELFDPLCRVLTMIRKPKAPTPLSDHVISASASLSRMLSHARSSRQPLRMQAHKPIPIASYNPKFEDDFAPDRHYDPDVERNSARKLRALHKKERSGAIRELRKDNRFLAGVKAREQADKDSAYNARMRKVEGEITSERAEEKQMQREKMRQKKRAGGR